MTDDAPGTVVIGIIDDGIAFAHERFRSGDKSRVKYFWMQDGVYAGSGGNVDYGRELDPGTIKGLFTKYSRNGALDEDALYRDAGLIDFHRRGHKAVNWRLAHGTHVMDLACGFDPARQRTDRPIVCVQLPARTTANTSGGDLTPYAYDGLWYICERAIEIGNGRPLPIVMNFSYGLIGGPHDGTSDLELIIETLIRERKQKFGQTVRIVLPAGNSYLTRCHAKVLFPRGGPDTAILPWRVLPDDKTPSYLDIWMPRRRGAENEARLEVSIRPPNGNEGPPLSDAKGGMLQWRPFGSALCTLQYNEFGWPTERGCFRITLRPTANFDRPLPIAPVGTWLVRLRKRALEPDEEVHAWVQRDDSLYGYPRLGRQSFLDHPDYKRFDHAGREIDVDIGRGFVQREGLLNAIGTGASSIVVGGFRRKEMSAAVYSGGGPATSREGPDALAVTDDSVVHGGVLAAGSRSGSVVAMGGTSVAAPQIARWIADRLAASQTGDRGDVKDRATEEEMPPRPSRPPVHGGRHRGVGRIERPPVVELARYVGMKTREDPPESA